MSAFSGEPINHIAQRFADLGRGQSHCVAEIGFASGLDFLLIAQCFLDRAHAASTLHFVGLESSPLHRDALAAAVAHNPSIANEAQELLQHYPEATAGYHRLALFQGRVHLNLVFGDIGSELSRMAQRGQGPVDTWWLTAPATESLASQCAQHVARLSSDGAILTARYASDEQAEAMRNHLAKEGFSAHTQTEPYPSSEGGKNKTRLTGRYCAPDSDALPFAQKPWFIQRPPPKPASRAAIIGGGLAGCLTARALAERGVDVTVFDRADEVASEASGNRAGVIYPSFSPHDSAQYRFYQQAYLHAVRRIPELLGNPDDINWSRCGVLRLATDDKAVQQQRQIADSPQWPVSVLQALSAERASHVANTPIEYSGLFFPQGGWLYPKALCRAAIEHPRITWRGGCDISSLRRAGDHWQLQLANGQTVESEAVVVANAFAARDLLADLGLPLPLSRIRGQISRVEATAGSAQLSTTICHKGYIVPAVQGQHEFGATFNLKDNDTELRSKDHGYNFDLLSAHLPQLTAQIPQTSRDTCSGRVGFRCQTPDYLPMIGPVPDVDFYQREYSALAKGQKHATLPLARALPQLYLNVAHGSRGITSSCLAADIIADHLFSSPAPLDQECLNALHPARFLTRAIKRQKPL